MITDKQGFILNYFYSYHALDHKSHATENGNWPQKDSKKWTYYVLNSDKLDVEFSTRILSGVFDF